MQLRNRQHWTRDRLHVVAELHTSLVFSVSRVKTLRCCLRKHSAILRSFGSISQDQVSQPNPKLTISGRGAWRTLTCCYTLPRYWDIASSGPSFNYRAALVRLSRIVPVQKAPYSCPKCRNVAQSACCCLEPYRKFTLADFDVISQSYR